MNRLSVILPVSKTRLRHIMTAIAAISLLAVTSCNKADSGADALLARYASAGSNSVGRADFSSLPDVPSLLGALRPATRASIAPLIDNKAVTGPDLVTVISDSTIMAVFGISDEDEFIGKIAEYTGLPSGKSGDYLAVCNGEGTVWLAADGLGYVVYSPGVRARTAAAATAFIAGLEKAAAKRPLPDETAAGLCREDAAVLRNGGFVSGTPSVLERVAPILPLFVAESETYLLNFSFVEKTCRLTLTALNADGKPVPRKGKPVDTGLLEFTGDGQNAALLVDVDDVVSIIQSTGIVRDETLGAISQCLDGTCMVSMKVDPQLLAGDVSGKPSVTIVTNLRENRGTECLAALHKVLGGEYVPGESLTVIQTVELEEEGGSYMDEPRYVAIKNRLKFNIEGDRFVVRVNSHDGYTALRNYADAIRGADAAFVCDYTSVRPGMKAVVTGRDGILNAELTLTGTDDTMLQFLCETLGVRK